MPDHVMTDMSQTTKSLLDKIHNYDEYTYLHCISVANYSVLMARQLGFSDQKLDILATAALLHDIGKIFVPQDILTKTSRLTEEEYRLIQEHTTLGANFLKEAGYSPIIAETVLEHHENIDGSGYPRHLKGDDINEYAKILRLTDSFDAMTSNRPYHASRNAREVLTILLGCSGKEFDTKLLSSFCDTIS